MRFSAYASYHVNRQRVLQSSASSASSAYKRSDPKQLTLVTLSYYKATLRLVTTVAYIAWSLWSAGRGQSEW